MDKVSEILRLGTRYSELEQQLKQVRSQIEELVHMPVVTERPIVKKRRAVAPPKTAPAPTGRRNPKGTTRAAVFSLLRGGKSGTIKEIHAQLPGFHEHSIENALRLLAQTNTITRVKAPGAKKYSYALAPSASPAVKYSKHRGLNGATPSPEAA
jgi:hypothetical protein